MKNLRVRFSPYGFLIVLLQALPNIAWVLYPPTPNALAGNVSSIALVEYGEHILGVLIVVLLLFLVNQAQTRVPRSAWAIAGFICIALYWGCWALYFAGIQPKPLIYAMVLLPPVAFFSVGVAEKVWPIPVASALFLLFHLAVALENYPL